MKKFQTISCAVLVAIAATTVQAVEYVVADDNPVSKLCVSAATDSPLRFFDKTTELRLTKAFVANKISCNGINITSFAKQAGNERNYQRLNRYRRGHVEISDLAKLTKASLPLTEVRGLVFNVAKP